MSFPLAPFFENKKTLFLTHAGADVDSVASAAAVYFSIKNQKKITIGVLDHLNLSAKAFAKKMKIPFSINPDFDSFDYLIAFDFSDIEMAGTQKKALENFYGQIFVFDHHKKTASPFTSNQNSLINEKAVSTAEIVFAWLKKSKIKINQRAATCIAAGIFVDSAGFRVADHNTFRIMAQVFEKSKKSFSELTSIFEVKRDISEGIARLKSAKRVRIFKSFENLIVFSDVGSFESSAAGALVFLGASIAFVGNEDNGRILISARAKSSVVEKTGFDLVKHVFVPLGKNFNGHGGGHAGAAAYNGTGKNITAVLKECVKLSHDFFEKHYKKKLQLKEYS